MYRKLIIALVLAVIIVTGGVLAYARLRNGRSTIPPEYYNQSSKQPVDASHTLDHVVVIVEENKPGQDVIGSRSAPYINHLAQTYSRASNYYAVTNPSLPNYLALTSGSTNGFTSDCNPPSVSCQANVTNIADRIEQANKSWKEYAESMPTPCYAHNSGEYAVKHNPFMYYPDITSNATRCNGHVVPFTQFSKDLGSTDMLPNYAFITPNLCSDMHDCSLRTGDQWLSKVVPNILGSPSFTKQHSLLVITWDEGDNSNNNVATLFIGADAKKAYVSSSYYSHYSLLHTIEMALNLQPLTKNDANAPAMNVMLQ